MQHEVTKTQRLLDSKGHIREPGYARKLIWEYRRKDIHAPAFRIKEWDYYLIANDSYGVAFTISDLGYMGLISVSFLNFQENWEHTETILDLFPMGSYHLGNTSSKGDALFENKRLKLTYRTESGKRLIRCDFPDFYQGRRLLVKLDLEQPDMDSMCIATPWKEKPTAFYYNQKIACMPAKGFARLGNDKFPFTPQRDFGVLDWGRGVWTYNNTWFWGIGSGELNGIPFGFNLGYGFSDRSSATENVIYYNGKVHKLQHVDFGIPKNAQGAYHFMKPWHITSSDQRFEGILKPILDRKANINALLAASQQHQIFGHFTGKATLDDGTVLSIKNFLCSVEVVHNRY